MGAMQLVSVLAVVFCLSGPDGCEGLVNDLQSCFATSHNCDPNHHFTRCVLHPDNHYSCSDDEFCGIHLHGNLTRIVCHPKRDEHKKCPHGMNRYPHGCHLYPDKDCHICCDNYRCIKQLVNQQGTKPPPTTATTTSEHGYSRCLSDYHCSHHPTFLDCITQPNLQYQCNPNEFCFVRISPRYIHINCRPKAEEQKCIEASWQNSPHCSGYHPNFDCHYCCHNRDCVRRLVSHSRTSTRLPPTTTHHTRNPHPKTTTTHQPHHHSTITHHPKTTTTPQLHHQSITTHIQAATTTEAQHTTNNTRSHTPSTTKQDPTTKLTLESTTTRDPTTLQESTTTTYHTTSQHYLTTTYLPTTTTTVPLRTSNPDIINHLTMTTKPTHTSDNTHHPTTDHHTTTNQDKTTTYYHLTPDANKPSHTSTPTTSTTTNHHAPSHHDQTSTEGHLAQHNSSTSRDPTASSVTTANSQKGSCVQCGDFQQKVPCSDMELFLDTVSVCPDPAASLCMTDIDVNLSGQLAVYKRCVQVQECLDLWYIGTSDNSACLQFNPMAYVWDLQCHFCCAGDGCNKQSVPDSATLWYPH